MAGFQGTLLIGRAKRAPHRGVQLRFRVIYIYIYICWSVCLRLSMGNPYQKNVLPKCVGGITWEELRGPNTRMLTVSFVSLKQSAALKP